MKLLRLLIPLYVIAACLGVLAAKYGHRRKAAGPAAPVSRPSRATATPAPPPPVRPRVMPADLEPAPVRARAIDLTVYSRFNFVARRLLEVPSPKEALPDELLHWSEPSRELPPERLGAFGLMFPTPDTVEATVGPSFYTPKELVMAVFAETRGLFPSRAASGSVYNPGVWRTGFGPGTFGDLTLARRLIAETRKRNKRTHLAYFPFKADKPSLLAWYCCAEAAEESVGARLYPLPPGMNLHFFIRQKSVGRQKPPYVAANAPVMSFGPFVNVGGGDVPRGAETYIDFYVLPAVRR